MNHHFQKNTIAFLLFALVCISMFTGCQKPEKWSYTGPRVYLIEGTPCERSDGLETIQQKLAEQRINARVYTPQNWLQIVTDIDAQPNEEVILVGHGHGAFLATQVVRHYAQPHKWKTIEAVITIDTYNKDWPHDFHALGWCEPHTQPMATLIGQNALLVRNYYQTAPCCRRWGSDLVTTRGTELECRHPYGWYDDFWTRRQVQGQTIGEEIPDVTHETIDNDPALVQRIVDLCRRAALSPYHYTPPEHHPDATHVEEKPQRSRSSPIVRQAT